MSEKKNKRFRTEGEQKRAATFRAFLERPGPQNIGTVEWPEPKPYALAGMRFCITGVLDTIEKEDIQALIVNSGGQVMSGPSSYLNYMVIGRDCGARKLEYAQEHNIPQLDEHGLFEFMKNTMEQATGEEPEDPYANDLKVQQKRSKDEEKGAKQEAKEKAKAEKEQLKAEKGTKSQSAKKKNANGTNGQAASAKKKTIKEENGDGVNGQSAKKASPKKTPKADGRKSSQSDDEDESADEKSSPPKRSRSGRPQRQAAARGNAKIKAELKKERDEGDSEESDDDEFVPEKEKKSIIDELDDD